MTPLYITPTLTPPIVETLAIEDVETGPKIWEHLGGQSLGEDVDELRSHRDVEDTNVPDGNELTYEVEINLNMLGALVLDKVSGEVDATDIVVIDKSNPW
jgi:hypothetical protein